MKESLVQNINLSKASLEANKISLLDLIHNLLEKILYTQSKPSQCKIALNNIPSAK